jgi:hypothetical protein
VADWGPFFQAATLAGGVLVHQLRQGLRPESSKSITKSSKEKVLQKGEKMKEVKKLGL